MPHTAQQHAFELEFQQQHNALVLKSGFKKHQRCEMPPAKPSVQSI
eukprot:CAMPEP_0202904506 /NCGR_PEP_ID=MMETSP1392-20130828/29690_1 /ASSEMBLY_ACC=CAM_ASM_000868 /TAXON_ID=225041 /ORGANISM="Chlamydomonas chlamydogama, Strain SAG 11-48b" /LENGTH=45 /DNA_ID= /DNA_START= /DNA_END= /DNA_ORIENTATION=